MTKIGPDMPEIRSNMPENWPNMGKNWAKYAKIKVFDTLIKIESLVLKGNHFK